MRFRWLSVAAWAAVAAGTAAVCLTAVSAVRSVVTDAPVQVLTAADVDRLLDQPDAQVVPLATLAPAPSAPSASDSPPPRANSTIPIPTDALATGRRAVSGRPVGPREQSQVGGRTDSQRTPSRTENEEATIAGAVSGAGIAGSAGSAIGATELAPQESETVALSGSDVATAGPTATSTGFASTTPSPTFAPVAPSPSAPGQQPTTPAAPTPSAPGASGQPGDPTAFPEPTPAPVPTPTSTAPSPGPGDAAAPSASVSPDPIGEPEASRTPGRRVSPWARWR